MATFIILKDRFNDQHAAEIHGEANPEAIKKLALETADSLAICDDVETLLLGICTARDAGAARLMRESDGVTWLYWIYPGGEFRAA